METALIQEELTQITMRIAQTRNNLKRSQLEGRKRELEQTLAEPSPRPRKKATATPPPEASPVRP